MMKIVARIFFQKKLRPRGRYGGLRVLYYDLQEEVHGIFDGLILEGIMVAGSPGTKSSSGTKNSLGEGDKTEDEVRVVKLGKKGYARMLTLDNIVFVLEKDFKVHRQ